jgi:uncharacterized protein (TIGR02270 family)
MASGVLWDIAEEHLDEADFLTDQWLAQTRSPEISLLRLQATTERRLRAHLDALVVGGPAVAERLLWPVLMGEREGSRVAAAQAMVLGADAGAIDRILRALRRTRHSDLRYDLLKALRLTAAPSLGPALRRALRADDPAPVQVAVLEILSVCGEDPGPVLPALLAASQDPAVLSAALVAAVAADRSPLVDLLDACLDHPVAAVRAAASRTGLIWNLGSAREACRAQARGAHGGDALLLLALAGDPRDVALLLEAVQSLELRAAALWALGFTGRIEAVEACLPWLDDGEPAVRRLAGEAVEAITGLRAPPSPVVAIDMPDGGLAEADASRDGESDEDAGSTAPRPPVPITELRDPDPSWVRDWWQAHRPSFRPQRRYVAGQPATGAGLLQAVREGPLRRAEPLLNALAIRSAGRSGVSSLRLDAAWPELPDETASALAHNRPLGWR